MNESETKEEFTERNFPRRNEVNNMAVNLMDQVYTTLKNHFGEDLTPMQWGGFLYMYAGVVTMLSSMTDKEKLSFFRGVVSTIEVRVKETLGEEC